MLIPDEKPTNTAAINLIQRTGPKPRIPFGENPFPPQ